MAPPKPLVSYASSPKLQQVKIKKTKKRRSNGLDAQNVVKSKRVREERKFKQGVPVNKGGTRTRTRRRKIKINKTKRKHIKKSHKTKTMRTKNNTKRRR